MMLSPGILVSSFEMLEILGRKSISLKEAALAFPRVGVCRSVDVIALIQKMSWIRVGGENCAEITISGKRIIGTPCHEKRLRQAILDFIDIYQPPWIQNATFGRSKVLAFAGAETRQVFVEAGLASGIDTETIAFWDMLAGRARGQKNDYLAAIGRIGERLTIQLEEKRTGRKPKWVSVENNADGYDVLSVVASDNRAQLSIEVKTTKMGYKGHFHITKNEWERAQAALFHCFHLWSLRGDSGEAAHLATLSLDDIAPHVPINAGNGEWESFLLSYETFKDRFIQPNISA